jgi:hypothetical protein
MARQRLTVEEKRRRGTLQPCRVPVAVPSAGGEPADFYSWLAGLSPVAQRHGRLFLEHCIPGTSERAALRAWAVAVAELEVLPRTRATSIEALGQAHTHAANLLAAMKWRRR